MTEKLRATQFRGTSAILPDKLKTPSSNLSASMNGEIKPHFNTSQNTRLGNPGHSVPDARTSPAFQTFSSQGNAFGTLNPVMPTYGMTPYSMGPMPPTWNPMFQTPQYWYPPNPNYPGYPPFPMMSPQMSTNHSVTGASEVAMPVKHSSQIADPKKAELNSSSELAANVSSYSEPEKSNRRESQGTSRSRGHTPVGGAPQYPQHSSPFTAYTNPPSLPQTGMSPYIHRPQPVYPTTPTSMEYAYHQMFSQYQGMLRDWENRMSLWRQKKGRSSIGSKSNVMGSQTSHRRRHSLATDEASSPTPSSILTQNEDESDDVQSRDDENVSVKASAASSKGRTTPAKFMRHSIARFSPNFSLLYTDLNYKFSLLVCSSKHDKLPELLESLPGPLYSHGGKSQKNEVKRYLTGLVKKHKCSAISEDDSSEGLTLLLNYLLCLLINNGDVEEVDIRDLLIENQDNDSINYDFENSTELSDLNDTFISPTKADKEVMEKLRKLLLLGKCRDFVELAMAQRLWGLALRFSKLMSHSLYVEVCHKFDIEHFNAVDPIQAYINVKTGTGLNVADIEEAANFDWKRHLGVILANSKDDEQRNFYCLELGKILASRRKFFAAQLCYLIGKCPFGMPNGELTHLVLIGLAPSSSEDLDFRNLTKNYFCIVLTMIYEYAVRNSDPEFFIPFLQYCKFFVAQKYVDCGQYDTAYRFCDSIAYNIKRDPCKFGTIFISQLLELSQMLTFKLCKQKESWVKDLETVSLQSASQSFELFSSLVDCTSSRLDKGSSSGPLMATWDDTLSNRQTPFASSTAVNHSKESSPLVQTYRHKNSKVVEKPNPVVFDFNNDSQKGKIAEGQGLGVASSGVKSLSREMHENSSIEFTNQNLRASRPGPAVPEDEESAAISESNHFYPNCGVYNQFSSMDNDKPEFVPEVEKQMESVENKQLVSDKFTSETQLRLNGHFEDKPPNPNANELEADLESASVDNRSINDSTLVNSQQFTESFPHIPPPPDEPFAYSYSSNFGTTGTPYATEYINLYDQNMRRDSTAQNNFAANYENVLELGDPAAFYDSQQMYGHKNAEEAAVRSSRSSANRSSHKSKNSNRTSEPGSVSDESGETSENEEEDDDEDEDEDDDVTTTDMTTTNESSMMSSLEHSANMSQSPIHSFPKPANVGHAAGAAQNKTSKFNFGANINDFNASIGMDTSVGKVPVPDPKSYSTSHITSANSAVVLDSSHQASAVPPPMGGAPNPFSRSANSNKLNQYKQYPNSFKVIETANISPPSFPTPQHMYEPSMAPQHLDNPSFPPENVSQNTQIVPQQVTAAEGKINSFYGAPDYGDIFPNNANRRDAAEDSNFVPVIPTFFNPKSFKKPAYFEPPKLPPNPVEQPMQQPLQSGAQPETKSHKT